MSRAPRSSLAILAFALTAAVWLLASAVPASAAVWVVASDAKVFPDSTPTTVQAVSISAARNEYEAAQVAVAGTVERSVTVSWGPSSDPLLVGSAELFKVGYVTITRPSTGVGSLPGLYPDPLLPAAFGAPTDLSAGANSFYLRVHVPSDAPAGLYSGTLIVDDPGDPLAAGYPAAPVRVPVSLTVYDFGWTQTSLNTAFPMDVRTALRSLAGVVPDTPANRATLSDTYYRFWAQHDISPTLLLPAPPVDVTTGQMNDLGLTAALSPYLSDSDTSPGLFSDTAFPLLRNWPWPGLDPIAVRPQLVTYLDELFRLYVANGWQDKGYLYVYDEPRYRQEVQTAQLAALAHAISAPLGFRARVLVTDWPRPQAGDGRLANTFLFDQVDIWCPSVYRYFACLPALEQRREAGAETWWYSYASFDPTDYPTFLIDKPLTDERATPWVTWRWNATGFLYWNTMRWGDAVTGAGYRDPYLDPVSFATSKGLIANGEASLVYPGYEPALGLTDPYAGPVSSLRLESLRDGIEDYEYLTLASAARRDVPASEAAAACTRQVAAAIADYRYGAMSPSAYRNLPAFTSNEVLYDAARAHLADYIVRSRSGLAPVSVSGVAQDAADGLPVAGARVSDGVVQTTTDAQGRFALPGVLPGWRLTVSHPLYLTAVTTGLGDDPAVAIALTRSPATLLIADFDTLPGFVVTNGGSAAPESSQVTSGSAGVSVTLRGGRAAATLSLPPGRRNLSSRRTLGLDVFSPGTLDHVHPWFLTLTLRDTHGRRAARTFLLRPGGWTHLSLALRGRGLDLHHLATATLQVSGGGHTIDVDTLVAS